MVSQKQNYIINHSKHIPIDINTTSTTLIATLSNSHAIHFAPFPYQKPLATLHTNRHLSKHPYLISH